MQSRDYTHQRLLLPYFIPARVVDGTGPGLVVIQRLGTKTSLQTDGNQRLARAASHVYCKRISRRDWGFPSVCGE